MCQEFYFSQASTYLALAAGLYVDSCSCVACSCKEYSLVVAVLWIAVDRICYVSNCRCWQVLQV